MSKNIILIPSRLAAKRLPNKPLLKIDGKSLIMHVYDNAIKCKIGRVFVATGDKKILNEIKKNGGKSIKTIKKHDTGTDRIFEALKNHKLSNLEFVINLQGDEPLINIKDIKNLVKITMKNKYCISTLACKISNKKIYKNKNIVKVFTTNKISYNKASNAKNFSRTARIQKNKNIYHHIGIYMYKLSTLKKFVKLHQTNNEKKEKLEQLRAIDNNIKIHVILAKSKPIGIDTKQDYMEIKKLMEYKN